MAETRTLDDILSSLRKSHEQAERRGKRRVVVTAVLAVFAACYMTWLHASLSKLDAAAVTDIARAQVEARLPDLGNRLSQIAIDAAPSVMDRGEDALLSAPAAVRHTLEERLASHTDGVLDEVAGKLDAELDAFVTPRLQHVADAGEDGAPPELDELMQELRKEYREQAHGLMFELYVAYANEIGGLNDYLVRLKEGENLSRRELIDKEIVEASVALRRHYIEPIEPLPTEGDETVRK